MLRAIYKLAISIFAIILIVVGIVLTPSPIPFGLIFVALGFLLLTFTAPDLVRWLRRRWRWLDRNLIALEKHLPSWLARQLHKTDGAKHDDDETNDEKLNQRA